MTIFAQWRRPVRISFAENSANLVTHTHRSVCVGSIVSSTPGHFEEALQVCLSRAQFCEALSPPRVECFVADISYGCLYVFLFNNRFSVCTERISTPATDVPAVRLEPDTRYPTMKNHGRS
jgi:hypothetical protein